MVIMMMTELHENPNILVPMDSWSLNFDDGFKKYMGIFAMEILFLIYYVLHN
jgi:hypothetical protein